MADPPHMLKLLRNHFIEHRFRLSIGHIANKEQIAILFNTNSKCLPVQRIKQVMPQNSRWSKTSLQVPPAALSSAEAIDVRAQSKHFTCNSSITTWTMYWPPNASRSYGFLLSRA